MSIRAVNSGIDSQMYGMYTMKYFVSTVYRLCRIWRSGKTSNSDALLLRI